MVRARIVPVLAILVTTLLLFGAPAQAQMVFDHSFAGSGSAAGQLKGPTGVAIDYATGDVYVADSDNNRVEQFDEAGTFIRTWGDHVNATTGGDVCPLNPGDQCQAGLSAGGAGQFANPTAIAVDNSSGPASGAVYVLDSGNNRIQRFSATGQFVLTWGKNVDVDTGGGLCTAASNDTCRSGAVSGAPGEPNASPPVPPQPSQAGEFAGWSTQSYRGGIAVDGSGHVYVGDPKAVPSPRVQEFDSMGAFLGQVAPGAQAPKSLRNVSDVAAGPAGVYVLDSEKAKLFEFSSFTSTGLESAYVRTFGLSNSVLTGVSAQDVAVDPANGYLLVADGRRGGCELNGSGGPHIFEYHPLGQLVDCTDQLSPPFQPPGGEGLTWGRMAISTNHRMYVTESATGKVHVFTVPTSQPPTVGPESASHITLATAVIKASVTGNLSDTSVHVEYGTAPCSSNPCASTAESPALTASLSPVDADVNLAELEPDTTYHYRLVATNAEGSEQGSERTFHTYPNPVFDPSCPNILARQQTRSAFLLDCRAYELVSASDQGGYNVTSDLVPGQTPFAGYPAAGDRALYSIKDGGIPNTGKPTNRGPDPYLAVRDPQNQRWDTSYVGIPADAPSSAPFSSTLAGADAGLTDFVFGGPEICSPCFADGSAGMPLRAPDGTLGQGMIGSLPITDPVPAGTVKQPLSANGDHFVFGSTQQFESNGNPENGNVTIYERDLGGGTTRVVSTDPSGSPIAAGQGIAELGISSDGSRVLIGEVVSVDSAGNRHYHLYMHLGSDPDSIDLTPGTAEGVLYDGMTADGSIVYFTSTDHYAGDGDSSEDLFRADVGPTSSTLTRVSAGTGGAGNVDTCDPAANSYNPQNWNVPPGGPTDCSVVAIGGGGGVASASGSIYFLSPEKLDGAGVQNAPNLFLATPGAPPKFVATLESSASTPLGALAHTYRSSFGKFVNPEGVAIDHSDGATYVLDTGKTALTPGAYVQKFDSHGNPVNSFGTASKLNGALSGSPFSELGNGAAFGQPVGFPTEVAVDNDPSSPDYRDLYVPDFGNESVKRFSSSGTYQATIPVGDVAHRPTGVAVDPANGHLYVSVAPFFGGNSTIDVFDASGNPVAPTSFPVTGVATGVGVDSAGTVYVPNGNDTRTYDSSGTFVGVLDSQPSFGVAVDSEDDHVYVDHHESVVEYDPAGVQVGPVFGSGVLSDSIGLAADAGGIVASDPKDGSVATFGKPQAPANPAYDSPLVIDSVREPESHHTADFQTTPSGAFAAIPSTLDLDASGFDNAGHYEVFRYDAPHERLECVSCDPTGAQPSTNASLASNGLSITEDGRLFFNSGEPLALRDTNSRLDVYEWENGKIELISSGQSAADSSLLTASDGTDVFFFTRETLVPSDHNGDLMKLYTARENGGFFVVPPPPPCAASDECHGPGSPAPGPPNINTGTGDGGNANAPACPKGSVGRHGRCVAKHHPRKRHPHRRRHRRPEQRRSGGRR
jgi:DNA-binding beta-propeller fold protein YncE